MIDRISQSLVSAENFHEKYSPILMQSSGYPDSEKDADNDVRCVCDYDRFHVTSEIFSLLAETDFNTHATGRHTEIPVNRCSALPRRGILRNPYLAAGILPIGRAAELGESILFASKFFFRHTFS